MIASNTVQKIRDIVGAAHTLDSDLDLFGYSYDSSFVPLVPVNKPDLVVRPRTTDEVSQVMTIAFENDIPVTPRGAASGRTGGSVPLKGGIALVLDRMTKIVELDERNMMVTAETGVKTVDLYNACAAKGLFYPPDPASWKFSTIGGNVAENSGGMRAVKYGVTKNYVMGLEVVLADGSVLQTGGKMIKNVTGYDLTSIFVGSEGTLGIITKVLMRLISMPKKRNTLQVMFSSLDDGCRMIHDMLQAGIVPAASEILDKICLTVAAERRNMKIPPGAAAAVIIEIDGEDDAALESQTNRIRSVAESCGSLLFRAAASQQEGDELWAIRRGISSAIATLAPDHFSEDISVPRDQFPEVVRLIQKIGEKHGLMITVYGHAGDGNLHPSILCDVSRPGEQEKVHRAIEDIFAAALSVGGTLSGEHGIGITKRPYFADAVGKTALRTMQAVKAALDPKGLLNPGKIW
jgi:glycolate oxidase